jgi:Tfp pilus assembly protein PilF
MRRFALVLIVTLTAACAPKPDAKIVTDVKAMEKERTPNKLLEKGRAYASVGDLTRAEQYLSAALDAGADSSDVLPILLRVCIAAKRYQVAIDYAAPVLQKHPDDYRLRFVVASLRENVGDAKVAREELESIVTAAPSEPDPHYALAVILRDDARDVVGADAQFREYLRLAPGGSHAEEARASLLKVVP